MQQLSANAPEFTGRTQGKGGFKKEVNLEKRTSVPVCELDFGRFDYAEQMGFQKCAFRVGKKGDFWLREKSIDIGVDGQLWFSDRRNAEDWMRDGTARLVRKNSMEGFDGVYTSCPLQGLDS